MGIFIVLSLWAFLFAKIMLLAKITWTRDCTGISGKTQVLYAIIFAGRYLDIITTYYNCPLSISLTRISFTAISYYIVLSIFFFYSKSLQTEYDTFRIELLILPCIVLGMLANYGFEIVEVFWAFSVYLESVAIIPQMHLISRIKQVENIVYYYISALSIYKVLHVMDCIYRFYVNEPFDRISLAAGVVQLMFYCVFFMSGTPLKSDMRATENNDEEAAVETEAKDEDIKYSKEEEAMKSAIVTEQLEQEKHNNLKEIVLTPASLTKDEKITIVTSAEAEDKESHESSARQ